MLKILINSLEIDFDGVIPYRMINPIFSNEVSHSFNIKTVNTKTNKDIIGQLHLPEINLNKKSYDAAIITDAFTFLGKVYFNSVTDKYIDFQFNSQNDFWNNAKEDIRKIGVPFVVSYLPVMNSKFMDEFHLTGQYCGYINGIDFNDGQLLEDETTAPVPFLQLNHIIEQIFDYLDIDIKKNALALNDDVDQLYLYNNNSNGRYKYYPFSFPLNPDFLNLFMVSISEGAYVLYCSGGHTIVDQSYVQVIMVSIDPVAAAAQFSFRVFQATVEDEYHITFELTPVVESLNGSNYIIVSKPYYDGLLEDQSKNHLPEISCGEFLKEVENLLAAVVFIDESSRSARIEFLKDILKSGEAVDISDYAEPVSDQIIDVKDGYKLEYEAPASDEYYSQRIVELTDLLTEKQSVATANDLPLVGSSNNDLRYVTAENSYYRYYLINFLRSQGWEFYSENVLPLQEDGGEYNIRTKFSPVLSKIVTLTFRDSRYSLPSFILTGDYLVLNVEKAGKFICLAEYDTDDFRLFFYRGNINHTFHVKTMPALTKTVSLPVCTHDVYGSDGNKISTANLSLRWDGEYGIYNQLYKEFIDLMVNHYREETRFIDWPLWMLNSFPWWKKVRVNHMNYLVHSINLDISKNSIKIKDTILVPA